MLSSAHLIYWRGVAMEYRFIGDTGLNASRICLGGGGLGSAIPLDASVRAVGCLRGGRRQLPRHGARLRRVDSGRGGRQRARHRRVAARSRGVRDRMIVATKGAHPELATINVDRMSPEEIGSDLSESLEALGVDSVDHLLAAPRRAVRAGGRDHGCAERPRRGRTHPRAGRFQLAAGAHRGGQRLRPRSWPDRFQRQPDCV